MISIIKEQIKNSNRIVILSGLKLEQEAGLNGVRQEERAYDIEVKFGYSPEEIATTEFLNRRVDVFYRYYKEEIIDMEHMMPTEAHYAMAELERQGKLLSVVTRSVYSLHYMAGIHNIIELHGSVNENTCPKCGRHFAAKYIVDSSGTPQCDTCKVVLKPGFALFGETIDNGKISMVADYVEKADTLLVVGSNLSSYLVRYALQYYQGNALILINDQQYPSDKQANYILYGQCRELLPQIIL